MERTFAAYDVPSVRCNYYVHMCVHACTCVRVCVCALMQSLSNPPQLKPYTTAQGKLTSWDGSGEGFTWDPTQQLWTLAIPIISLTLAVHSFTITLAPKIRDSLKKYSRNKALGTLFWCLATTTFLVNFYNYGAMRFDQLTNPFQRYPQAHALRPIVDWLPLGLGILVGILPSVWISHNTIPPYILFPPESKHCKCLKNSTLSSCKTITLSIYLTGIFIFVTYTTVSIIPMFLLAFIYPLEVISTVVFLTTVIVSLSFILIPYIVLTGSLIVCDYSNYTYIHTHTQSQIHHRMFPMMFLEHG